MPLKHVSNILILDLHNTSDTVVKSRMALGLHRQLKQWQSLQRVIVDETAPSADLNSSSK